VTDGPLTRQELVRRLADVEVLIVRLGHSIDREILAASTTLRAIVSATTGLDHIDLDAARERGIAVLSLQGQKEFLRTIDATAEHTWALLLAVRRRLVPASLSVRGGEWERDRFVGRELRGARLGVLGLGRIGSKVAGYGQAFGMDVSGYDPYIDYFPGGVRRVKSLDQLLAESDVLSVHIPLNDETSRLLDAERLARLPRGAVLVNTSRGEIIDEDALADALEQGQLAGAALDTICNERDPAMRNAGRLMAMARDGDYLVITPHIGGATQESMASTELFMARQLAQFLQAHN
jgi:D-3-phosphoglycerate dehydrogenase